MKGFIAGVIFAIVAEGVITVAIIAKNVKEVNE